MVLELDARRQAQKALSLAGQWKGRQAYLCLEQFGVRSFDILMGPAVRRFYSIAGRLLCVDAYDDWSTRVAEQHI